MRYGSFRLYVRGGALLWLLREIGMPSVNLALIRKRMPEGLRFSFPGTAQGMSVQDGERWLGA